MSRILRREAAKRDLVEQFVWYAENASLDIADRFLVSVERTLRRLAGAPGSGSPVAATREELRGLRRSSVNGFEKILVFYFPLPDGIDLLRVLHGSRDLAQLFEDQESA